MLVQPEWLIAHYRDPAVRVLDPRRPEDYERGHVPGAVNVFTAMKEPADPLHVLSAEHAQAAIRSFGISNDTIVVVMGDGMLSGRIWWVVKLYGGRDVRLLDGGHAAWVAAGGPVTSEPTTVTEATFVARFDPALISLAEDIVRELPTGTTRILDVRSDREWEGENRFDHRRVGRIPGAVHMEWTKMLTDAEPWRFRSVDAIRDELAKHGIRPGDRVITICEVGQRAAHTAFALRLAGLDDVRVYDASHREWDNRDDTPLDPPAPSPE